MENQTELSTSAQSAEKAYLRGTLVISLLLSAVICWIAIWHSLSASMFFPSWFTPLYVLASLLLSATALSYAYGLRKSLVQSPVGHKTPVRSILIGMPLLIVASSSLHQFYPFRFDAIQRVEGIPFCVLGDSSCPRITFNFFFTGIAFSLLALFGSMYIAGIKQLTMFGYAIVSLLLLIPNDNCQNPFNDPWNELLGASPLMFLPASVGVAIGVCGLAGVYPKFSVAIIYAISLALFVLGMGHLFKVVW